MTIKYTGERISAGFTMRGANTDPNRPPEPPKKDTGPQLYRDPKYPAMVQNGLTESFADAKRFHKPQFLSSPSGYISPVPYGGFGPFSTEGKGVQFKYGSGGHKFGGGNTRGENRGIRFNDRTSSVRVMDSNWNQGKRTVYENQAKPREQIVDPFSGKTSIVKGHFYHDKKP